MVHTVGGDTRGCAGNTPTRHAIFSLFNFFIGVEQSRICEWDVGIWDSPVQSKARQSSR